MAPQSQLETVDGRGGGAVAWTPGDRLYLLVLEGSSTVVHPLPTSGTVAIGRSPDAGISVQDRSVSRQHAQLVLERGEARIVDLGSHNGVSLNGHPVTGSEALHSGDVVMLGDVTLVFHCGERPFPAGALLDPLQLRERLTAELERVVSYERQVGVLALDPGPAAPATADLLRAAAPSLRLIDLAGRLGPYLIIVLPELTREEASAAAERLLEVFAPMAPQVRAGLATAPQDGLNVEALLATARAAALAATPGKVQVSQAATHRLTMGDRSVLVADPAMVQTFELLRQLAAGSIPVLIHGETGVGKESAAWAVHHWSPRASQSYSALNCAAIPEGLAESELFGHERGAFSGADRARTGRLEQASGGTLFLDEVADLSLPIQAKLLRALETKRITRLGDTREREIDVRIVAATHRVLKTEVSAGRFREDLYFRLSAAVVHLPPLRDRPRELPLLAASFLADACARLGRPPLHLSAGAMGLLAAHPWPGNVRELKNAMDYVAITTRGGIVEPSHLPISAPSGPPGPQQPAPGQNSADRPPPEPKSRSFRPLAEEVRDLERQRMTEALEASGGVQTHAAQLIGMPIRTFGYKLKQYRLPLPGKGTPP